VKTLFRKSDNDSTTLSSPLTFAIWSLVISAAAVIVIGGLVFSVHQDGVSWSLLAYLPHWVVGYIFLWPMFRLTRVTMESNGILVKGFLRSARIPFHQIRAGDFHYQRGCAIVTLHVSEDSAFAPRVIFMPTMGMQPLENPCLCEFQNNAELSLRRVSAWESIWLNIRRIASVPRRP